MTSPAPLRPALAVALAATLSACGVSERDPHRLESLAQSVADIPLSAETTSPPPPKEAGRRPLKVELLTPHQLWDARDGAVGVARAVAPAPPGFRDPEAPPQSTSASPAPRPTRRLIQLGAYASQTAAHAAWTRLQAQEPGLGAVAPVFEPVQSGGRSLIRLKVTADPEQAKALCARIAASDPWCASPATGRASTGST